MMIETISIDVSGETSYRLQHQGFLLLSIRSLGQKKKQKLT